MSKPSPLSSDDHSIVEINTLRHSAAHIMALAIKRFFGKDSAIGYGIGPSIADGFYYDFKLPRELQEKDLAEIQGLMAKIIRENHDFKCREVSLDEARKTFKDQPYKLELIDGLSKGNLDDNGLPIEGSDPLKITVYESGDFVDLCRGPHILNTRQIDPDAIKLMSVSAAYWRGDSQRDSLQRVYGTAFLSKKDLDQYLWQRAEAERRDHRKIGKELELFHFDETSPGMPYWLPNGNRILNELISFWRREHDARGYQEIATPILNDKSLWETSGHWAHYRDDMFLVPISETTTYSLKPMNCPNALVVYNLKPRSHKELPIRYSDCDPLHRFEASGALHGLLRVREFRQDDAHIFIKEDQIEAEYGRILEICDYFYKVFNMSYSLRIGTRPKDFMGDIESWDRAEEALHRILTNQVGVGNYKIAKGDGAFYGPKVDIVMKDSLGREWQMGTIQLDFQLPRRFNSSYIDDKGQKQTPVLIHRVIYGSLERFIGILIEHTEGKFPLWIAPTQACIITISDRHLDYAKEVYATLKKDDYRYRLTIDDASERMNAKIRDAQMKKIPYMLVVGDKEAENKTVSVRSRQGTDLGSMSISDFSARMKEEIDLLKYD